MKQMKKKQYLLILHTMTLKLTKFMMLKQPNSKIRILLKDHSQKRKGSKGLNLYLS